MTDLAKNLKRLRQAKNLTKPELAALLQVTAETVTAWERSESTPAMDQLPVIANALDTDVLTLLYPVEDSDDQPFRPGCSFVLGSAVLYYLLLIITGEWGIILGPIVFTAICTCLILDAIHKK